MNKPKTPSLDQMRLELMGGLSKQQREANKAKFLEPSKVKELLYHGTGADIKQFIPSLKTNSTFLSHDPYLASSFAENRSATNNGLPNVMPVHAQIKNPWDYENPDHVKSVVDELNKKKDYFGAPSGMDYEPKLNMGKWATVESPEIQKIIKELGHDSFYVKEGNKKNIGVYEPNQIKSAIGNRGTYDLNDPDINHAKGGRIDNLSPEDMMAEMIYGGRTPPRFQYDKGGSVVKWAMNEVIPMMEHLKSIGVFGNQGTCDITNPNINKAAGGSVDFPSVVEPTHMAGGGVIDKALPHVGHAFALDPMYELAKAVASSRWGHALESAGDLAQVYAPMKASLPLQLATYSPELNSNEDAELAARRAMPPLSTIKPYR